MEKFNILRAISLSVVVFSLALIGFLTGKEDKVDREGIYYVGFLLGFVFASVALGFLVELIIAFIKK